MQCGRPEFNPWVGKIPWRRERYPLQYSGLENSMDCSPWGRKESDTTKQLKCPKYPKNTHKNKSFFFLHFKNYAWYGLDRLD